MDTSEITEMIDCLKQLKNDSQEILIPAFGNKDQFELHGANYDFFMDLNRSGHRLEKCTFQLREKLRKSIILVRFDLVGRSHTNPIGDYRHAGENIPCPHVHFANFEPVGIGAALPLDDPLVRIALSQKTEYIAGLKEFLTRINVGNRTDFRYTLNEQQSLF